MKTFSKEHRSAFAVIACVLIVLLIAALVLGTYVARVMYIRTVGINLVPIKDYEIVSLPYYQQNDPRWSSEKIGSSSSSMGGEGCLVSSVANAMSYMGQDVNPQAVNESLSEIDGFDGPNLIWYKINQSYPEIDYKYSRTFSNKTIEDHLKNGRLPIVKVRYKGLGIYHWVVIVGAKDGEYLIADPLSKVTEPAQLSTHGGRIYAYRVLVESDNKA